MKRVINDIEAIVLAAGKGVRIESHKPKVLFQIGGTPLVSHIIRNMRNLGISTITVITGHKSDQVERILGKEFGNLDFYNQDPLNGTGGALHQYLVNRKQDTYSSILVVNGDDSMFYKKRSIENLISSHQKGRYDASFLVVKDDMDRGYRKIILKADGSFDYLTKKPSTVGYTLTNCYVFSVPYIYKYLSNAKFPDEIKVTDFLYGSGSFNPRIIDSEEWFGINTKEELVLARKRWKEKLQ